MAVPVRLYHFAKKSDVEGAEIDDQAIAFCQDEQVIITHGTEYGGSKVTVDSSITQDSSNPVSSSAIYTALDGKQPKLIEGTNIDIDPETNIISSPNEVLIQETEPTSGGTDSKLYFEVTDEDEELYIDTEAPMDGSSYARCNGAWVKVLSQSELDDRYALRETYDINNTNEVSQLNLLTASSASSSTTAISNMQEVSWPTGTSGSVSKKIEPNVYYVFEEVKKLTITFYDVDEGVHGVYQFQFDSGSTPTTLSLPSGLKWLGGSMPTIESNKTYVVSIHNNLAKMEVYS